jgi:adenylosuccinate synthase
MFLTGLDVFDDLDEIKLCTSYKLGDQVIDGALPSLIDDLGKL